MGTPLQNMIIKQSNKYDWHVRKYGSIENYYGLDDNRFIIRRNQINIRENEFVMIYVRRAQSYPLSKTLNKYILRDVNEFAEETIYIKTINSS